MLSARRIRYFVFLIIATSWLTFSCSDSDEDTLSGPIYQVDDDDGVFPDLPTRCADLGIDLGFDIDGERSAELLPMEGMEFPTFLLELRAHLNECYAAGNYEDIYNGLSDEFWERLEGVSIYGDGCGNPYFIAFWKTEPKPGRQGFSLLVLEFRWITEDTPKKGFLIQELDDLALLFPDYSTDGVPKYPDPASVVKPENAQFYGTLSTGAVNNFSREYFHDSKVFYRTLDLTFSGEQDFTGASRVVTGDFCSWYDYSGCQ